MPDLARLELRGHDAGDVYFNYRFLCARSPAFMAAGQTNYVDRKSGMRVIVGHYMGDKSALDDPRMNLTKGAHTLLLLSLSHILPTPT